ncbi:hypothetical protein SN15_12695, partial [Stenotrophomonas maltophilia]
MEALIVMLGLVLLAIPLLLVVALVKISGLRRRVELLEASLSDAASVPAVRAPTAGPHPPAAEWDPV